MDIAQCTGVSQHFSKVTLNTSMQLEAQNKACSDLLMGIYLCSHDNMSC